MFVIMHCFHLVVLQALLQSYFIVKCEYYEKVNTSPSITNKDDFIFYENVPSPIACVQKCNFKKAHTHYESGKCYCFTKEKSSEELEASYQIIEMPDQNIKSSSGSDQNLIKRNCTDWLYAGYNTSGEYIIKPKETAYTVFCDMKTDGGGWIKFQNRFDGSVNFTRSWNEYKIGFGILSGEFWLGNEIVHQLTMSGMNELRISASDFDSNVKFAKFTNFVLKSEEFDYTLTYDVCVTGICDSLRNQKDQQFSTYDRDNDNIATSCARGYKCGWWFNGCFETNYNGIYRQADELFPYAHGVHWLIWKQLHETLKTTEMMLR